MFRVHIKTMCLAALTAACLLAGACAPLVPIDQDKASGFIATFISSKVTGEPGTVAWSPGGRYLAFLKKKSDQVTLYDPLTGEQNPFDIDNPFFLSWADQDTLLIAHGSSDNPLITMLEISTKKTIRYPLPPNTVAVFGEPGAHYAWAFVERHEWRGIGVDAQYGLYRPDWKKNSIGEIVNIKRIISINAKGIPFIRGWADVGPDPVGGKAVLLQLIAPPRAPAYLKVLAIDAVTLEETEIMKIRDDWLTTRASWSPDGQRLALTGNDRHLKVLSMDGILNTLDGEVIGTSPAWDPRGGQIYFGGFLIADDGSERTRLLSGEVKDTSTAFFSPKGGRMALDVKGKLWLIAGIAPSPRAPKKSPTVLQEKASSLRGLYHNGLITKEDYQSRLDALLQKFGEGR